MLPFTAIQSNRRESKARLVYARTTDSRLTIFCFVCSKYYIYIYILPKDSNIMINQHIDVTIERFQELLQPIKETVSIVICIVDLFDLKGVS